ncbi:MAG: ABC-type transport auxiliary lipoprotein family protein [Bacteroidales bacterium]
MKNNVLILAGMIMLMAGCMSEKTVVRKYYTLELPEETHNIRPDPPEWIPGTCEIRQVMINPVYDNREIANRSGSHEIIYYMYHQWAVRPAEAMHQLLYEFLSEAELFEAVYKRYNRDIPDYFFEAKVNDIEVVEEGETFSAHLNINLSLVDNKNNNVILSHRADRQEVLKKKNINLFASELSNLLYEELMAFELLLRDRKELFE